MSEAEDTKGAGVKIPPPLIVIGFLLLGYGVDWYYPWQALPVEGGLDGVGRGVAIVLSLVAVTIAGWTVITIFRARTSLEPWKPTTTIITTGIFAWSRNPIYLSFCLFAIGVGLYLNSLWLLLTVLPSALALYVWVIRKEEVYLEAKFGDAYRQYKSQVRCWF